MATGRGDEEDGGMSNGRRLPIREYHESAERKDGVCEGGNRPETYVGPDTHSLVKPDSMDQLPCISSMHSQVEACEADVAC